jgi:hypothetical protein
MISSTLIRMQSKGECALQIFPSTTTAAWVAHMLLLARAFEPYGYGCSTYSHSTGLWFFNILTALSN